VVASYGRISTKTRTSVDPGDCIVLVASISVSRIPITPDIGRAKLGAASERKTIRHSAKESKLAALGRMVTLTKV
jgi:hypothetical protein